MNDYRMDLHVHTCLSPCSESEMSPQAIIAKSVELGLDAIAICDHNSAENVIAVRSVGQRQGVVVIGGMEVSSVEEVHVVTLFEQDDSLFEMQEIVYDRLFGVNDEKYFGEQLIVDEDGNVTGSTSKLLIGSTTMTVNEIVDTTHKLGGLAIASHVDREAFSMLGQLGFIPKGLQLDALELSARCDDDKIDEYRCHGFELVRSSDAHYPWDIGKVYTTFTLETLELSEISMAFRGIGGRAVVI